MNNRTRSLSLLRIPSGSRQSLSDKYHTWQVPVLGQKRGREGAEPSWRRETRGDKGRGLRVSTYPRPERTRLVFQRVRNCLREYADDLSSVLTSAHSTQNLSQQLNSSQQILHDTESQLKAVKFRLAQIEELEAKYSLFLRLWAGVTNMSQAYILYGGVNVKASLESVNAGCLECVQTLCHIEAHLESLLGTFHVTLQGKSQVYIFQARWEHKRSTLNVTYLTVSHGVSGFARVLPGDSYEITFRYGQHKWKSKCKVSQHQAPSCHPDVLTLPCLLVEPLQVRVQELKCLGKGLILGETRYDTLDLLCIQSQTVTLNLSQTGSIKLDLVIQWRPVDNCSIEVPFYLSDTSLHKSSHISSPHRYSSAPYNNLDSRILRCNTSSSRYSLPAGMTSSAYLTPPPDFVPSFLSQSIEPSPAQSIASRSTYHPHSSPHRTQAEVYQHDRHGSEGVGSLGMGSPAMGSPGMGSPGVGSQDSHSFETTEFLNNDNVNRTTDDIDTGNSLQRFSTHAQVHTLNASNRVTSGQAFTTKYTVTDSQSKNCSSFKKQSAAKSKSLFNTETITYNRNFCENSVSSMTHPYLTGTVNDPIYDNLTVKPSTSQSFHTIPSRITDFTRNNAQDDSDLNANFRSKHSDSNSNTIRHSDSDFNDFRDDLDSTIESINEVIDIDDALQAFSFLESDEYTIVDEAAAKQLNKTTGYTAAADQSASNHTAADQSGADYTAADQSGASYTAADQSGAEYTASDQSAADYRFSNHTATDKAAAGAIGTFAGQAAEQNPAADDSPAEKSKVDDLLAEYLTQDLIQQDSNRISIASESTIYSGGFSSSCSTAFSSTGYSTDSGVVTTGYSNSDFSSKRLSSDIPISAKNSAISERHIVSREFEEAQDEPMDNIVSSRL